MAAAFHLTTLMGTILIFFAPTTFFPQGLLAVKGVINENIV